jgi:hypothetical protein
MGGMAHIALAFDYRHMGYLVPESRVVMAVKAEPRR